MNPITAQASTDLHRRRLSILFLGTQMALGGAQRSLLDQAAWFRGHDHDVTCAFLYDKENLAGAWGRGLTFPLMSLSSIRSTDNILKKSGGLVIGLLRLWFLLRRGKFDVVQTFTYDSNLLGLPLAWLAGVPVRIATHHGIIEGFPRLIERLHSVVVNVGMASILVNVSRKVLEQAAAVGIRREHMTVIQNGIPSVVPQNQDRVSTRIELGVSLHEILLLSVGRLVYQKGHEYLIQAVESVRGELPHVRAVICGEGPLRKQLQSQIDRLGLRGVATLVGNRLDIERFLGSADVFVLPSRWEGLPVALLEAMDRGLPVIATRVEGVEEVVENETQGLLVPPEDARALAESIRRLVLDADLRHRMSLGARARVREAYTIDIMCEKYLSLMLNLLAQNQ